MEHRIDAVADRLTGIKRVYIVGIEVLIDGGKHIEILGHIEIVVIGLLRPGRQKARKSQKTNDDFFHVHKSTI